MIGSPKSKRMKKVLQPNGIKKQAGVQISDKIVFKQNKSEEIKRNISFQSKDQITKKLPS